LRARLLALCRSSSSIHTSNSVAWIETTREDEWDGELAEVHGKVVDRDHGRVDNIMQIHSLDPAAMEGHLGVYNAAMSGTKTLRKVERELIALVVSDINDCHY
jgi:alkylhydroperoxidase family enzyme